MRILGIDPGVALTGWGVIDTDKTRDNGLALVDYGVIKTAKDLEQGQRLHEIYTQLGILIKKYKPDIASMEKLFFCRNVTTAISVGEARGVILMAVKEGNLPLKEFTPMQVKSGVCGYGKADKKQVQTMVKAILQMDEIPKPDDAADGLAVAICCSSSVKFDK